MLKRSWYLSSGTNLFFSHQIDAFEVKTKKYFFFAFVMQMVQVNDQSHKICEYGFNWKALTVQEPNGLPFLAPSRGKPIPWPDKCQEFSFNFTLLFKLFASAKAK